MRAFVAVELTESSRQRIERLQSTLQALIADVRAVRWVRPELLHLTVEFLGDHSPVRISGDWRVIVETLCQQYSFGVPCDALGQFPARGRARVLWVGTHRCDLWDRLCKKVTDALAAKGVASENLRTVEPRVAERAREPQRSTPHVTVGRARGGVSLDSRVVSRCERVLFDPTPLTLEVAAVSLFESELTAAGPCYQRLERHPLLPREPV